MSHINITNREYRDLEVSTRDAKTSTASIFIALRRVGNSFAGTIQDVDVKMIRGFRLERRRVRGEKTRLVVHRTPRFVLTRYLHLRRELCSRSLQIRRSLFGDSRTVHRAVAPAGS